MNIFSRAAGVLTREKTTSSNESKTPLNKKGVPVLPSGGRPSVVATAQKNLTAEIIDGKKILRADYDLKLVDIIRQLTRHNPDMSQALSDSVALINTGIQTIKFDKSVKPAQAREMKIYIEEQSRKWGAGTAGLHGLMNKMVSQMLIGGAISNEWVPNKDKTAIVNLVFLNPENVAWVRKNNLYKPYQRVYRNIFSTNSLGSFGSEPTLKKLNPHTYRYLAINGDEDSPYGIPPYMSALAGIKTQAKMTDNIEFIMTSMGLLGYLDAKMEKPDQQDNESDGVYRQRLESLLDDMKTRVQQGMRDGINVGYKDDHEFDFKSTTSSTQNANELWQMNELQIASGLKFDAAFLGRSYNSSETSITILFMKMLSILTNYQSILKYNLEYGLALTLRMAGFKFKHMSLEFHRSTITDMLKMQQAEEIKIRNQRTLYADGIISQDGYATATGHIEPDQKEPRVPIDADKQQENVLDKKARKDDKNKSKRDTTDKSNPQGTVRKQGSN